MKRTGLIASASVLVVLVFAASPALAAFAARLFVADLSGYEEVPSISTSGEGWFAASVRRDSIAFKLSYSDLEGEVQQAHVHFAQKGVNGGVSAFLCSNLDGAPLGTPPCPPPPATVSGVITAQDVVGPAAQGIASGELDELIAAMRAGVTYANVHTDAFPAGEIRGQLRGGLDR